MLEKERRIYYQCIVYSICNLLDTSEDKIRCGTAEAPSTEVQEAVNKLLTVLAGAINKNDCLAKGNGELRTVIKKLTPKHPPGAWVCGCDVPWPVTWAKVCDECGRYRTTTKGNK